MLSAQASLSPWLPVYVMQEKLRSRCHLKKAARCESFIGQLCSRIHLMGVWPLGRFRSARLLSFREVQ